MVLLLGNYFVVIADLLLFFFLCRSSIITFFPFLLSLTSTRSNIIMFFPCWRRCQCYLYFAFNIRAIFLFLSDVKRNREYQTYFTDYHGFFFISCESNIPFGCPSFWRQTEFNRCVFLGVMLINFMSRKHHVLYPFFGKPKCKKTKKHTHTRKHIYSPTHTHSQITYENKIKKKTGS